MLQLSDGKINLYVKAKEANIESNVPGFKIQDFDEDVRFHDGSSEGKREIWAGLFLTGLTDVDAIAQTFTCSFQSNFEWIPSAEDALAWIQDPVNFKPTWQPRIKFFNASEVHSFEPELYGTGLTASRC